MTSITKIHHKSLEFSDEAIIAKRKGNVEVAKILFEKAFWLEKAAVFSMKKDAKIPFSHLVMIRSAAALAYKAGLYQESLKLIALGLKEHPENLALPELQPVLNAIKEVMPEMNLKNYSVKGILTAADAKVQEIKVETISSTQPYLIIVPTEMMDEIVRSFWKNEVLVEITAYSEGVLILDRISLAA